MNKKQRIYWNRRFEADNNIWGLNPSNSCVLAEKYLALANIENRFDYMVCGDEVMKGKPDPDIFLKVAQKAGCNPDQCIVLEDSENGIIAASRARMKPVFIPDNKGLSKNVRKLLFKEFNSLLEVKDYIKSVLEEHIII